MVCAHAISFPQRNTRSTLGGVAPPAKAKRAAAKAKVKAKATAAIVALSQAVLTQIGEGGRREVLDPLARLECP